MIPSLWDESTSHKDNHIVLAVLIAAAAIALNFGVPHFAVSGSATSHVAGELISAVLGTVIGFTLISICSSAEQRWFKVLGWGFIAAAGFEVFHAITSSPAIVEALGNSDQISNWASLVGRSVLSGFALWAALTIEKRTDKGGIGASYRWAVAIAATIVVASGLITVFSAPGGFSVVPVTGLSIVPGAVFLAAYVIVQRRSSSSHYTLFAFTLFLLTSGVADVAFMAYATKSMDGYFAGQHLFKLLASGVMLVGLLAESHRLHRFEVKARQELGRVNESLNQSNLSLTSASNDLRALNRIGHIAGISHSIADQFDEIGEVVRSRIAVDRLGIGVLDTGRATCTIEAIYGISIVGREVGNVVPLVGTHYGDVLFGRETIIVDDSNVASILEKTPRLKVDLELGIRSWLTTPIVANDEVVGILLVRSRKVLAYGAREVQFVQQVASQLAGPVSRDRIKKITAA